MLDHNFTSFRTFMRICDGELSKTPDWSFDRCPHFHAQTGISRLSKNEEKCWQHPRCVKWCKLMQSGSCFHLLWNFTLISSKSLKKLQVIKLLGQTRFFPTDFSQTSPTSPLVKHSGPRTFRCKSFLRGALGKPGNFGILMSWCITIFYMTYRIYKKCTCIYVYIYIQTICIY